MKIQLLEHSALLDLANDLLSEPPGSPETVVEMLRSELVARGVSYRHALCKRVQESAAPLETLELDSILNLLELLEINGDATRGPRGKVAAAPIRAVITGPGRYNVYGTIPKDILLQKTPIDTLDSLMVSRIATVREENEEQFSAAVSEMGGMIITPEKWSGLEKRKPAGTSWIEYLNRRLEQSGKAHGFVRTEFPESWRTYRPESQSDNHFKRWKKETGDGEEHLWKCRSVYGRWLYVWTEGMSPSASSQIQLTPDDAIRTMYSLDHVAKLPLRFDYEEGDQYTELAVNALIPLAEYRYLTTIGQRLETSGFPFRYRFLVDAWLTAEKTLSERLRVTFRGRKDNNEENARN